MGGCVKGGITTLFILLKTLRVYKLSSLLCFHGYNFYGFSFSRLENLSKTKTHKNYAVCSRLSVYIQFPMFIIHKSVIFTVCIANLFCRMISAIWCWIALPKNGSRFCYRTSKILRGKAYRRLRRQQTQVEG